MGNGRVCTGESHMSGRPIHSECTRESMIWTALASQLAEVLLAAGVLAAGELDVDEDESDELEDSFGAPDAFDESGEEFEEEETVLELLARESVA
ncbi:hypothetical protein GCM10009691_37960 [Brevibacterium picturae]|uniref:Uncharacterized protein n=2 Tax=Brevibacterium picturae TaxID=260553 RepID=A0ABN2CN93_9MICO